ncbi:MAG: FecCD family ABC transporter permease, partial [Pseudomonadota bacterium]
MLRSHPLLLLLILLALLLVALAASLSLGAVNVPLAESLGVIVRHLAGAPAEASTADLVIWQIRLPRVLLSVLVGAALAVSGALVQGLFRNPLADPSLIGVSGGAAVGAAIAIVLGGVVEGALGLGNAQWLLPLLAFAGGGAVTALVYRLGVSPLGTSVATMLLAGVAINAMTGACISYLSTVAEDARLRNLVFWLMGSFNAASWPKVVWVAPFTLLILVMIPFVWRGLNALLLGESEARHLGFSVERLRWRVILVTALAVGAAVAAV